MIAVTSLGLSKRDIYSNTTIWTRGSVCCLHKKLKANRHGAKATFSRSVKSYFPKANLYIAFLWRKTSRVYLQIWLTSICFFLERDFLLNLLLSRWPKTKIARFSITLWSLLKFCLKNSDDGACFELLQLNRVYQKETNPNSRKKLVKNVSEF